MHCLCPFSNASDCILTVTNLLEEVPPRQTMYIVFVPLTNSYDCILSVTNLEEVLPRITLWQSVVVSTASVSVILSASVSSKLKGWSAGCSSRWEHLVYYAVEASEGCILVAGATHRTRLARCMTRPTASSTRFDGRRSVEFMQSQESWLRDCL